MNDTNEGYNKEEDWGVLGIGNEVMISKERYG